MTSHELLGWLVDVVIAFALLESLALLAWRRVSGRGIAPRDFALNMVAGLALMLALRAVVRDAGLAWVCLCLLGAGTAHLTDMALRWRRQAGPASDTKAPQGANQRVTV